MLGEHGNATQKGPRVWTHITCWGGDSANHFTAAPSSWTWRSLMYFMSWNETSKGFKLVLTTNRGSFIQKTHRLFIEMREPEVLTNLWVLGFIPAVLLCLLIFSPSLWFVASGPFHRPLICYPNSRKLCICWGIFIHSLVVAVNIHGKWTVNVGSTGNKLQFPLSSLRNCVCQCKSVVHWAGNQPQQTQPADKYHSGKNPTGSFFFSFVYFGEILSPRLCRKQW